VAQRGEGKAAFVRQLLRKNPAANPNAVNTAWKAAGKPDTIARSHIMSIRAEMGLTQKRAPEPKLGKGATMRMPPAQTGGRTVPAGNPRFNQGKSAFLRELYKKDPSASFKAVNEAWKRAGKPGAISEPLTYLVRSEMGITKKRGVKRKASVTMAKKPAPSGAGRPGSAAATVAVPAPQTKTALDLEAEIDRLLFKVIEKGGMEDVEDALRSARRRVILGNGR
jgi:hypothetical protein